jgi:hypothetical protein
MRAGIVGFGNKAIRLARRDSEAGSNVLVIQLHDLRANPRSKRRLGGTKANGLARLAAEVRRQQR